MGVSLPNNNSIERPRSRERYLIINYLRFYYMFVCLLISGRFTLVWWTGGRRWCRLLLLREEEMINFINCDVFIMNRGCIVTEAIETLLLFNWMKRRARWASEWLVFRIIARRREISRTKPLIVWRRRWIFLDSQLHTSHICKTINQWFCSIYPQGCL